MPVLETLRLSGFIKRLHLEGIIPGPLNMMNNMEALDTLHIGGGNVISFTQLIDVFPATLTTLITNNINLTYDGPTSTITSIRHLTITKIEVLPALENIIETSFPQLSALAISGEITCHMTFSLLKHKLKEVKFTAMYDEDENRNEYSIEKKCYDSTPYHIIKQTTNGNADQLYAYDSRVEPAVKIEHVESFALKLLCPSVEQLTFSTARKI